MSKIKVKTDPRYTKRKMSKAVGKNIFKTLTEPITNSDDSYRRIEKNAIKGDTKFLRKTKLITIIITRKNRKVQIIDQAEGMDKKDMESNFGIYGADKSGWSRGFPVRGIFGQGIEDVLYYHESGVIKSIKNNKAYLCRFFWESDERFIDPKNLGIVTKKLRKNWQIPEGNGTVVEFILDKNTPIHNHEKLVKKLNSIYMLRFINSDYKRRVNLIDVSRGGVKRPKRLSYKFPEGKLLDKKEFVMEFEDYKPVKIEAQVILSDYSLSRISEERESGLLVFDKENTVYDFTFFDLDNDPGTERLFGFVKLIGAREIILAKVNQKKHPEEILTDSRDGFNKEHSFYRELVDSLWDWLWPIVNRQRQMEEKKGDLLPPKLRRKYKEIFDILNKSYNDLIGESFSGTITTSRKERPIGGIEFARPHIKMTVGKQYGLQLRIDTNVIPIGSKIKISNERRKVNFTPSCIVIKEEDKNKENIASKIITLTSTKIDVVDTIKATFKRRSDRTVVSVIEKEIFYPDDGIIFNPNYFQALKGKRSKLNLYVDFNKIAIGENVIIESDNPRVVLEKKSIILKKKDIISEKIGRVDVFFIGKEIDQEANITALTKDYKCTAKVCVKEKDQSPPSASSGRFRDWDFEKLPLPMQSLFDSTENSPRYGYILINKAHPLNKKYFGENPRKIGIESSPVAQVYLAEIILNRCLDVMIIDALRKNVLERRFPDREHLDINNYIEDQKCKIGLAIHERFVNPDLFEKVKNISKNEPGFLKTIRSLPSISEDELNKLNDRERKIIQMRVLRKGKPFTLEEIANKLNLTRERVRQLLEGALIKLGKKPLKRDIKKKFSGSIKDKKQNKEKEEIIIRKREKIITSIIKIVADYYNIDPKNIIGRRRNKEFVFPRMIVAFLMREQLGISFSKIGRKLGGRDHTTAIYSYKKISKAYSNNEKIKREIDNIKEAF